MTTEERRKKIREGLAGQYWIQYRDLNEENIPVYLWDCPWSDCPDKWREECLEFADAILAYLTEQGVVMKDSIDLEYGSTTPYGIAVRDMLSGSYTLTAPLTEE